MVGKRIPIRGRGAAKNPANRFETLHYERNLGRMDAADPAPKTQFLKDSPRSIITYNQSPDLGYEASVNPYRGCEHGCSYCYARPYHEYLGFSAGLDFETKILVKESAPELLRRELSSPGWKPQVLTLSGVTDPYQPVERTLQLTRRCLEVVAEFRNPVQIVTKNHLIRRDLDLLAELAKIEAAAVCLSLVTLDSSLSRTMEPRTSTPTRRLAAIEDLSGAGVPTGVLVAPVIPGLTEHELPAILEAAAKAGARFAEYILLRLPLAVGPLFEDWLQRNVPQRKDKILNRIKEIRGGRLYDSRFCSRLKGKGIFAEQISRLFTVARKKEGISEGWPQLSTAAFRTARPQQRSLFD
ncbi:MAG: PA0069 family radical SAM protein [Deltaproteobacteria bacterium]|nr:MAG: PA0069 family radical SAM protein [Deltaproteobacteria bacterium]